MSNPSFKPMTGEQRQQSIQARKDKAIWAKENLDLEWGSDAEVWKDLARKYNTRLPMYTQPATETKYVKRLFKHVGIDLSIYLEACGVKTLKQLAQMNPREPASASVGFALEWVDEYKTEMSE